jgi:hypothetical protein
MKEFNFLCFFIIFSIIKNIMSLNKFISVKAIFTAANLTSKAGYPIDYNSPKFNVSVNNGQYLLQGTFATGSSVASTEIDFDITLPKVDNLFDPAEIKAGIDLSRIINHSQGAESIASGACYNPWGVAVQSPGVIRIFLRAEKNNLSGAAIFFTINLTINALV